MEDFLRERGGPAQRASVRRVKVAGESLLLRQRENMKDSPLTSCALIFPCHNEEGAIPSVLDSALRAKEQLIQRHSLKKLEIIVVNDHSTDNSAKILESYSGKIKIVHLKGRKGYGEAIKTGIEYTTCEWIAFCDLDGTCSPSDLEFLIKKTQETSAEIIWGIRLHKKSAMPYTRRLGNLLYRWMIWVLSGKVWIADPCSGFRLFKKSVFSSVVCELPSGLHFSPALTAWCVRKKVSFSCVNISYEERIGESKLKTLRDGVLFSWTLFSWLILKKF
ncbi:MAG: glycosyltransferase family 2 protein [Bdellovibrionales bacterium]|nr:glycosyltransferase family 2 protein [Bdellovibrionales bacterium]